MFRLILTLFIVIIFATPNGFAKSPPPGTGFQDVPTNVLLMLDTSGSMAWDASNGSVDYPYDVAFDSLGNKYVASYYSEVEKYDSSDNFVTSWGEYDNGGATNGKFRYLYALDIDSNDKIYVSDYKRGRVQIFDTDGNYLSKFSVSTSYSYGLAIDSNDNIYVVNQNGDVEKYNTSGTLLDTWGSVNGAYLIATHNEAGIDYVYVTKYSSQRVYKYDTDGNAVNSFGGNNYFSTSFYPYGIEVDNDGNIYVGEYGGNHRVYKYDSSGNYEEYFGGYGTTLGKFYYPMGIGKDNDGNIWVADYYNDRIQAVDGSSQWPGDGATRLEQAKQVIKDIVSNSTLTDGADFGLLEWNSSASMVVDISPTGASDIYNGIDSLTAGGGTSLDHAMAKANSYLHSNGFISHGDWCKKNVLIIISDGEWTDHSASALASQLYNNHDVKTFVVGFTVSSSSAGAANYVTIAQNGGTYPDSPVFASNWQVLYESISDYILQTIASTLTFSTPTIMPEVSTNDSIIQAVFKYKTDGQWKGHLNKYLLTDDGFIDSLQWDAGDILNNVAAADRNIWTVGSGLSTADLNNFLTANIDELRVGLLENAGTALTDEELELLIDFVRGVDSYSEFPSGTDSDGDTLITGERWKLADIYHSRAVLVGTPNAFTSEESAANTESYYRYANGYNDFKTGDAASRDDMVYVGSNGGMLHAFNSDNGSEAWAFVPPSILPNFKDMVSDTSGESTAIYGVDGSPTVKDIYYDGAWHTILISGARQGGHTYFALDVTDPTAPSHLFTFAHNTLTETVSYWDADGVRTDYDTADVIDSQYDFSKLGEAWSQPIIQRVPVGDSGAMTWTALIGGGYNAAVNDEYGAQFYVLNLEDGGKIIQNLDISDTENSNKIENSVPPRLTAITPDSSTEFQGNGDPNGAVIYFSDLEGKLWKINLTDQGTLYDTTRLFNTEATANNTRYTFHENAASIDTEFNLWQYYGTGDQQSLGDISNQIANRAYGFKHSTPMTTFSATESDVSNMADVSAGACPTDDEDGWYIDLDANEKVTAKATVDNSYVYFSRYTPDSGDICSAGTAKISEHSFTCGSIEAEFDLGYGVPTESIIHKNKIYLGISTDQAVGTLPTGWVKDGNLIIGSPTNDSTGSVEIESWWEDF